MKLLEEFVRETEFSLLLSSMYVILDSFETWMGIITLTYTYIIDALEMIVHKLRLGRYFTWSDRENESRRRVSSALLRISNFQFCIIFTAIIKSPFCLHRVVRKMIFLHVILNVHLTFTSCQQHRPNEEPLNYYCVNMCLAFIDYLINGAYICFDKFPKFFWLNWCLH